jgi:regulator of PEP synthase PpsR (kinase-PPPase family)
VNQVELHEVSDSTGETVRRFATAIRAQFPDEELVEVGHPRVETVDDLRLVVGRAAGRPAVMVYTLVEPELRRAMAAFCEDAKLEAVDLLGPSIDAVARVTGHAARMQPGARPRLDSAYFRRMAAMEFAVRYDDGAGSGLLEADIVLIGVSRTSKTPLSMYLAYLGYKTANVPIVHGVTPPAQVFEVDARKIVGLTITPERLVEIRGARGRALGTIRGYAAFDAVQRDLDEAAALHRRLGCPTVDVSDLAIEEAAQRVIRLIDQRRAAENLSA